MTGFSAVSPNDIWAIGILTTKNRAVVKRTLAALPIYSFVLGLIALFGVMAIAGKITPLTGGNGKPDTNTVVPSLFEHIFPHWFTGVAFAMIVIGALVPAAFMSIAAANLFTRNIYKEYLRRGASEREETQVSKIVSLVVKGGALLFILLIQPQFSIDLQLLGGAIILQTLPSVMLGLYTRWLHRGALIAGWAAGLIASVWTFYLTPNAALKEPHWGGTAFALSHLGLHISPDVDTVLYSLAGVVNEETGWGRRGETWTFMRALGAGGFSKDCTNSARSRPARVQTSCS